MAINLEKSARTSYSKEELIRIEDLSKLELLVYSEILNHTKAMSYIVEMREWIRNNKLDETNVHSVLVWAMNEIRSTRRENQSLIEDTGVAWSLVHELEVAWKKNTRYEALFFKEVAGMMHGGVSA